MDTATTSETARKGRSPHRVVLKPEVYRAAARKAVEEDERLDRLVNLLLCRALGVDEAATPRPRP